MSELEHTAALIAALDVWNAAGDDSGPPAERSRWRLAGRTDDDESDPLDRKAALR